MSLNWATDPEDHALALFPLPAGLGHDKPDEIDDCGNDQDDDRSDEQPRLGNEQHGQHEQVVRDVAAMDWIGDPHVGAVW